MLPSRARLRRGVEMHTVTRRGVRARRDDLTVHLLPAQAFARDHPALGTAPSRAAVVVGRAAGGAVQRNRLRRRVRHSLLEVFPQLPAGSQLVIRAGAGAHRLDPVQMRVALAAAITGASRRAEGRWDSTGGGS